MIAMWQIILPFNPVATPRPSIKRTKTGILTYYTEKYATYLEEVSNYLSDHQLINDDFYQTIACEMGVVMEVDFFIQRAKNQKKVNTILRTYAPDIDNLLKGAMDCIFNQSKIKDSCVVGVTAFKYNTINNARTEIRLRRVDELEKIQYNFSEISQVDWQISLPFNPVATPRPGVKRTKTGILTYYPKKYQDYKTAMKTYIEDQEMYNQDFFQVIQSSFGMIAEIDYFCQMAKNQRKLEKLMKVTAPDIDNLVKGTLDSIFHYGLPIKDSRVVGLIAYKFNTLKNPHTEVRIRGI
ncbi:RusA family crossover junction endodeoxyribonuclease [Melissococcus plutonius]